MVFGRSHTKHTHMMLNLIRERERTLPSTFETRQEWVSSSPGRSPTLVQVVEGVTRCLPKRTKANEDWEAEIKDADWQSRKREDVIADALIQARSGLAATNDC